jgi:phosphatidate cytidylyltransferase
MFVAPKWAFFGLILWAAGTCVWEYMTITMGAEKKTERALTTALGMAVFSALYWVPGQALLVLMAAVITAMLFYLFKYESIQNSTQHIGNSITGIVYGAVLICTMALIHRDAGTAGPFWVLMSMGIVWMSDTGAYFSGRAFGKRKLYPAVSPNKSVEGAIGGFISSILLGFLFDKGFTALAGNGFQTTLFGLEMLTIDLQWKELGIVNILILTIPANILGQCGDLAESLIKRAHNVKDSGTVIRGHGGMLDRIDALIFATPWVYYFYITFVA